jgi:DNA gyrase subunit A
MADHDRIIPVNIEQQLQSSYIDYSMSVIVARALPDVRDGLKPVHRRVMYGMNDLGVAYNKPYKKSARIVGEVLGKYHPHGDSSVYDAMVRMAQDWSMRYPLVDGQGNYGSMDGDSPAAMRYTEARLSRLSDELLDDIDKDTVDFRLNFDDSLEEPTVLPSKIPNLLINGSSGIAVGMATNMLPHNLREVCDGVIATIDNPEISIEELMKHIPAPDMPTGGIIYGTNGIKEAYETGKGKVVVRGRATIEHEDGRDVIIITEIPFQVNKAYLVEKIAELVNEEKIQGISNVRDESDRTGIRVVVELKKDAIANIVLSSLYKYTQLQTSYGINNIALVNQRPQVLNLKELIQEFVKFRIEVIIRRTKFELKQAKDKAHIIEGLLIALDNLDEVIAIIRGSKTVDDAKQALIARFNLSDIQAKAILDMRLQKLTGLLIQSPELLNNLKFF